MLIAIVGSSLPVTGLDLVAALSCAGVPLMSFVAGQVVLARRGRPVVEGEAPPAGRYVPLGFVICALVSRPSSAYTSSCSASSADPARPPAPSPRPAPSIMELRPRGCGMRGLRAGGKCKIAKAVGRDGAVGSRGR
ncbi:hypothetical protein V2I01_01665 [Micromonospora sp. BRA006-A]|nr:hypothetical protein [Micromonospora sp. BRA006-A]